ncbi:MAG: hypothetical protein AB1531_10690 [Chloroflexota bacterium]
MDARFLRNVLLKSLTLFLVFDFLVAFLPAGIGKVSLYNSLFEGRLRFPFGEDSARSYNLSLFDLDAMFAAHIINSAPKPADEYRVILIGDSSTWGTLLRPDETLSGQLDSAGLTACDGRTVRVYNLGYPTVSLTKDLMVLDYALRYDPDLILWPLTLESFPLDKQLSSPIVANNAARVDDLITRYSLSLDPADPDLVRPGFWGLTLIGQRRALADLIRLQLYGVLWSATGIDQTYPADYTRAQTDFDTDITYHGQTGPTLDENQLSFDIFDAVLSAAGDIPVILVNEPILISAGENSHLRYNFLYPRWAYDDWRQMMQSMAAARGWNYLDLWNLIPAEQFTNSAIHVTPAAETFVVEQVKLSIQEQICP